MEQRYNPAYVLFAKDKSALPGLGRVANLCELLCLGGLYWVFLWVWGPQIRTYSLPLMASGYVAAVLYISWISPQYQHGDDLRQRGIGSWRRAFIRTDNFVQALLRFGFITIIGSIIILLAAFVKNPDVFSQINWLAVSLKFLLYHASGIIQGCFTLFILMRMMAIFAVNPFQSAAKKQEKVGLTLMVSFAFALMHWPNIPVVVILMLLTPVILWQFYRTPNFFLLVCTHAILGTLLHRVYELPMRVGPFYYNPDKYILRELFPPLAKLIGNLW